MILAQANDRLELFDVALADLGWGLLIAALIGAVGGLVYAALTSPAPREEDVQDVDGEEGD